MYSPLTESVVRVKVVFAVSISLRDFNRTRFPSFQRQGSLDLHFRTQGMWDY